MSVSLFKQAISICGLSNREAAEFLNVSPRTIESWIQCRRTPPHDAWAKLSDLYAKMIAAGDAKQWPSERCSATVKAMLRLSENKN